ncbi:MAG: hypothetical protein LQ347_000197 [Umbilicaria vellea]|nr:MAG: hypothetical protein LQ347_000197 [Umbilicaria vellea]
MQCPGRALETQSDSTRLALQFPTLTINGRVGSWLFQPEHVNMVTNTEDHTFDDNSSSLGDSAYEFIDDSSISVATSDEDDQEHTGTSSSSGDEHENEHKQEHKPEHRHQDEQENEQVSKREHEPADGVGDEENLPSGGSQTTQSSNSLTGCQNSPTTRTSVREYIESKGPEQNGEIEHGTHFGTSYIMFEETKGLHSHPRANIDVSHIVKTFNDQETSDVLSQIRADWKPVQLVATVRQSMIEKGLSVDEPYKLLYVGKNSARAAIVSKIAAALCSNQEHGRASSQRFNVVPISSFGGGSSPEVELIDSFGPEIIVDECTSATIVPTTRGRDEIHILLNNTIRNRVSSMWDGSKFVIRPKWKLPVVAVFYLSKNDDIGARQVRGCVHSFMVRHAVPTIVVSESPLWGEAREPITLDHRSLHLCIEEGGSEGSSKRVLERVPVDLATFLRIDAEQLGRNLACLSSAKGRVHYTKEHPVESDNPSDDVEKSPLDVFAFRSNLGGIRQYRAPEIRSLLILGSILLLAMVYTTATLCLQKFTQPSSEAEVPYNLHTSSVSLVSTSVTTVGSVTISPSTSVKPSVVAPVKIHKPTSKSISVTHMNTDLAYFLLDSHSLAPNKSDQFKIHVIGDCHIVLRPPHWFTLLRRPPKLFFKVTRKNKILEHQLSTLFDGVYAIKLPREDAYGPINVSVWTRSKPRIEESFQMDFGTPWLKVAGWKKAAQNLTEQLQKDWGTVQISLASVVKQTNAGLRNFMEDASRITDEVRRKAEKISKTSLNKTSKTTDLLLTQTKVLSYSVSRSFRSQSLAASKRLSAEGGKFPKELTKQVRQASRLLSHYARVFTQAATGVDVQEIAHEAAVFRKRHLRETQKSALRLWWRIRGMSPGKSPVVRTNGEPIPKRGKFGRRSNR